jgi:hypothetical protein
LLIPAALNSGSDRGEALGEKTSSIGIAAHALVPRDLVQGSFLGADATRPAQRHHPTKCAPIKAADRSKLSKNKVPPAPENPCGFVTAMRRRDETIENCER